MSGGLRRHSLESARNVVDSVLKEFTELEAARRSRRRTSPRQGSSQRFADAEPRIDFQPHVEPGAPGDALPRFFTLDELVESIEKVTRSRRQRVAQDLLRSRAASRLRSWGISTASKSGAKTWSVSIRAGCNRPPSGCDNIFEGRRCVRPCAKFPPGPVCNQHSTTIDHT